VSRETRLGWIDASDEVPVARQCRLAQVARATVYAQRTPRAASEADLLLCRLIDEEYTRRPFYGSRRMVVYLRSQGAVVNRKRVQRLMRQLGLWGMAPGPNTSVRHTQHKIYPYLLRGVEVTRPNQVWSTDITYIRLARGFAYLVAVIDWYSHVKFFVRHLHLTTTIIPRPPVDNDAAPQHEAVDSPPPGGSVVAHRLPASFAFGLTRRWRGLPQ
jgi:putative transposase